MKHSLLGVVIALGALGGISDATESGPSATTTTAPAGRRLVVLDPGHGGTNTGATGAVLGAREKQLTLAIARLVAGKLEQAGLAVQLTRAYDETMTLRQRLAVANDAGADAFVSIHANASPARSQRGIETYVLSPVAVDVDGRALRSDLRRSRPGVDDEIAAVLDDVERGALQWESAELASSVQDALIDARGVRGTDGDRGVRQASQHVLLGATMPAILVEVGFIDHPIEGKELMQPEVQEQIATAIAKGIVAEVGEK